MVYTPRFFPLQNAVCFIILTYLVPILFTVYIQDVLKLKNNSGTKSLSEYYPGTCFVRRTVNVESCVEFGHRGLITFDLLTLK